MNFQFAKLSRDDIHQFAGNDDHFANLFANEFRHHFFVR